MKLYAQALAIGLSAQAMMQDMYPILTTSSPIFTPRKHTKMKYADHKRMKAKRKNRRLSK